MLNATKDYIVVNAKSGSAICHFGEYCSSTKEVLNPFVSEPSIVESSLGLLPVILVLMGCLFFVMFVSVLLFKSRGSQRWKINP